MCGPGSCLRNRVMQRLVDALLNDVSGWGSHGCPSVELRYGWALFPKIQSCAHACYATLSCWQCREKYLSETRSMSNDHVKQEVGQASGVTYAVWIF